MPLGLQPSRHPHGVARQHPAFVTGEDVDGSGEVFEEPGEVFAVGHFAQCDDFRPRPTVERIRVNDLQLDRHVPA